MVWAADKVRKPKEMCASPNLVGSPLQRRVLVLFPLSLSKKKSMDGGGTLKREN